MKRRKEKLSEFPHNGVERRISTETSHRLMRSMLDKKRVARTGPRWVVIIPVGVLVVLTTAGLLIRTACQ